MLEKTLIGIFMGINFLHFAMANPQNTQKLPREENKLQIVYSKNTEVFCTLINLTNFWEKRHTGFPFASEARGRFLPFQNHQAVKMTNKLLEKHWHNFFCSLALYLTDFPDAQVSVALPEKYSNLFSRKIEDYISAARDFFKKSVYEEFWLKKRDFYEELKVSLEEKLKNINIPEILEDFYGDKKDAYFIIPTPQMPDMGLNVELSVEQKLYSYCVLGPFESERGPNYFINIGDLVNNAFHEFGHTFLEAALERHDDLLQKHDSLYRKAKKGMDRKGYRT